MRNVPMAEFAGDTLAFVLAARAGEDIVITRHGEPLAKLTMVDAAAPSPDEAQAARREEARRAEQREAVHALFEEGRKHRAKYGSVTIDEIIEWKNEGRR